MGVGPLAQSYSAKPRGEPVMLFQCCMGESQAVARLTSVGSDVTKLSALADNTVRVLTIRPDNTFGPSPFRLVMRSM